MGQGVKWRTLGVVWLCLLLPACCPGRCCATNLPACKVDCKDKWRNIVKLACAGKQARSADLTGEQSVG